MFDKANVQISIFNTPYWYIKRANKKKKPTNNA